MLRRVVPTLRQSANNNVVRGFSSSSNNVDLPRITERRLNEVGRGGRASDAGIKVAVFGATGFLGRYVCSGLGKLLLSVCTIGVFYVMFVRGCLIGLLEGKKLIDLLLQRNSNITSDLMHLYGITV